MDATTARMAAGLMLTEDGAPEVREVTVTFINGQIFTGVMQEWGGGTGLPRVTLGEAIVPNNRARRTVTLDWDLVVSVEVAYSDGSTERAP